MILYTWYVRAYIEKTTKKNTSAVRLICIIHTYLVGYHELHHADRRLHLFPDQVHDQLLRHHHVADAASQHHFAHARVLVAELVTANASAAAAAAVAATATKTSKHQQYEM